MSTIDTAPEKTWLGHPRGLTILFGTELWERFSYYGMRALLVLYLVKYVLLPGHVEHVLFYPQVKHGFEWIAAALSFVFAYIWHWISAASFYIANPIIFLVMLAIAIAAPISISYFQKKSISPSSKIVAACLATGVLLLALMGWLGVTPALVPAGIVPENMPLQPFASLIYGTYTGFIYASPLLGGWIGDNVLGQRKTAVIGVFGMMIGQFMLSSQALLFPALLLLIFAGGFFKTNTTAQVGMLYKPGDSRRDQAYSIYYVGVNIGAFVAPFVAGTLGELVGWQYGFAAAGVGMILALINYFAGWKYLPSDGVKPKGERAPKQPMNAAERKSIWVLLIIVLPLILWWACYEQQGNIIALFASDNTDRRLIPGLVNWEIPVTWFQSFNPFMIFAFTPLVLGMWTRQARTLKEPNSMYKMVFGAVLLGMSFLVIAYASWQGHGGRISWMWLLGHFVLITTGEIYLSPISQSLFSKVAPARMASLAMAIVFLPNFLGGGLLQGYLGTFWSKMSHPMFFVMVACVGFTAALILFLMEKPLEPYLKKSHD